MAASQAPTTPTSGFSTSGVTTSFGSHRRRRKSLAVPGYAVPCRNRFGYQLGLFALTALAPTIPGAALLKAHAESAGIDGLELALKGGQMGSPDYFGWIKRGGGV